MTAGSELNVGHEFNAMGYYRPVSYFNEGKKSEFYGRKEFNEVVAANKEFTERYILKLGESIS